MEIQNTNQTPSQDLKKYLANKSISDVLEQTDNKLAMMLIDRQSEITFANVDKGQPFMAYDQKELKKILCAIIAVFNDTIKVKNDKMTAVEIYECASILIDWKLERVEDFILCLKMVKTGSLGIIYNRIDILIILEFWKKYLELKLDYKESQYLSEKSQYGDFRNEIDTRLIQAELSQKAKEERINSQPVKLDANELYAKAKNIIQENNKKYE